MSQGQVVQVQDRHVVETTLVQLGARLPESLPIHDRLQLAYCQLPAPTAAHSPTLRDVACTLLATFDPTQADWPAHFALLLFHPTCLDGLAATLLSSLDLPGAESSPAHVAAVAAHWSALLRAAKADPLAAHLPAPRFKANTVHAANRAPLAACRALADAPAVYDKLLWHRPAPPPAPPLPPDLAFDAVRPPDVPAVQASNSLVRSAAAVASWPGLGLRARGGVLVAWAFWGAAGSLRTVFVVPEWRGKGLGRALVAAMLAGGARDGSGEAWREWLARREWVSTDVAADNAASQALMRGLGAQRGWDVVWPSIDLERVEG